MAVEYRDFPTVEWTLYFKNTGTADTPILADIQALDATFEPRRQGRVHAAPPHAAVPCLPNDYEPLETPLGPGATKRITAAGGRPTNTRSALLQRRAGPGEGVIVVVGWPGQWAAEFARDAGDRPAHSRRPGADALQAAPRRGGPHAADRRCSSGQGDRIRSQNVWRRWMLAHNLPRPGGKLPPRPAGRVQLAPVRRDDQRQHRRARSSSSTAISKKG